MTYLTQLDVVNDMLASLGESPINTLDEGHPLVAAGLRAINTASWREQSKSWWFNLELVKLVPDVTGTIYVPEDTIRVDPRDGTQAYTQRGRRLYNNFASASIDKYNFSGAVECWLVRHIAFEDLPAPAQTLVSYSAQKDFQKAYDADRDKFQQLVIDYRDALVTLNAEHIRNRNVNLLNTASVAGKLARVAPFYGSNRLPTLP
jgi:hypothetical protein